MCSSTIAAQQARHKQVGILIIGAGPTGLGAATRLQQHGHSDWLLVDQAPEPGGLACTAVTPQGFLFDMGGHVMFSHWAYFDELLDAAVGRDGWNVLQRVSYVWLRGRWVAYPFQNNISALDKEDQIACLTGLIDAKVAAATATDKPASFDDWILRRLGRGIADLFMRPYNFKVWGVPPSQMGCGWLGERVATVDVDRAVANVIRGEEDAGWGPNAVFRFPKRGGTGGMWKSVAALLPAAKQVYSTRVTAIDRDARQVVLSDGSSVQYKALISTIPLDTTLRWLGRRDLAGRLVHSSSHIVGVGIRGPCPHGSKCWLYFPEDNCPFYRATVFSNYAQANCPAATQQLPTLCLADSSSPGGDDAAAAAAAATATAAAAAAVSSGPYWSLMFEVTESSCKRVNHEPVQLAGGTWPAVVRDVLRGAVATGLLQAGAEVVSLYHTRLEHGYPTPSLDRDEVLAEALPWLQAEAGIWSRGRFGSYKYEVGNQDHSLMLGVEAVDNILYGSKEVTLLHPDVANAGKEEGLRYAGAGAGVRTGRAKSPSWGGGSSRR